MTWPPSFPLAKAFLDQLERTNGLPVTRIDAIRGELVRIERLPAGQRGIALDRLATQLEGDLPASRDQAKLREVIGAVGDLAAALR